MEFSSIAGMGRSAYLCVEQNCLEEATRRKRLQKALRCQVPESSLCGVETATQLSQWVSPLRQTEHWPFCVEWPPRHTVPGPTGDPN